MPSLNDVDKCARCGSDPIICAQNGNHPYVEIECHLGHQARRVVKFARGEDIDATLARAIAQWNDINSDYE